MAFAAAEALFDGDETKARKLLLRALKVGEVRSRGVYLPDQKTLDDGCLRDDFEPEAIPADRWLPWEFLPVYQGQLSVKMRALQRLLPASALLRRVCRGYPDVQLSRPDGERLARAAKLKASWIPLPSWIPLLCSDSASETSETTRALAKSYFDEQRWPLRHALHWIACQKIEALALTPEELRGRRWQALMYKGDADGLASVNPAYELLTALKAAKVRAIGPDHNELPPEFWDDQSFDPETWPRGTARHITSAHPQPRRQGVMPPPPTTSSLVSTASVLARLERRPTPTIWIEPPRIILAAAFASRRAGPRVKRAGGKARSAGPANPGNKAQIRNILDFVSEFFTGRLARHEPKESRRDHHSDTGSSGAARVDHSPNVGAIALRRPRAGDHPTLEAARRHFRG